MAVHQAALAQKVFEEGLIFHLKRVSQKPLKGSRKEILLRHPPESVGRHVSGSIQARVSGK